ncbi:RNA 2',3'-cyclic phosphodiesterase [Streptomyces rapamycinicus]|uniref:RNA 2',3'-cyclic phosphodiesterase n=2 Tax=Streptomyces rapamycinicus TaxID=1226757 RepID=A0A0A0NIN3_STRRN|nr:RNA 2',3'-cyclic phosphodiesterase [Streptomyces rapamycinicus]AGP57071.1 2'-5' RNA ligase [Streptomyces rapamycinicus NRRL 5491]MBB4784706.1 2'-5' RNA ligase [Streptomyces rapamycinicus]RLV79815.1 2'-5' RNA ligase [Streptomyces rapamycinicus NRRL 5491]UTO64973.1 RNA 2',3'-cyclic phosphodiesterase [Streptomyces rapamycinicus]UTP32929.1 RNA 2',3'-cyclic phosphodiesterase [Streptomyces rapamycinicus NRRL 5491]
MRLFAAVLPPEAAVAELAARVKALRALPGADGLRWTEREGWHFTLAFFGEVAEDVLPELHTRLARAAHRHHPHELRLAGGGRFDDRVVWVGVDGDSEALRRLADSAEAGGRRAGVPMDRHRPYHPHLTIARARARSSGHGSPHHGSSHHGSSHHGSSGHGSPHHGSTTSLAPYVDGLMDFAGREWTVGELSLVRSHPPAPGVPGQQPRYEVVAAWPLGH